MYILSANMWFQKLMKQFFFGIDKVVYNFIPKIYDLLISIARTSVLSQADILDMADRIYKLLAIFMIFKVTLSLITYVVNPDDFSDKSKGVSKLGLNIVISLILLIITPYIFNLGYRVQSVILEDNSLAALIFGSEKTDESSFINSAGDEMAYITMSAFVNPNVSIKEFGKCIELVSDNGNFNPECSGLKFDDQNQSQSYEPDDKYKDDSMYALTDMGIHSNPNFSIQTLKNYVAGVNHKNFGLLFRQELVLATDKANGNFIMDYNYIISTAVGVVIVLLLITFCMDVALRSIKLAFLQLIAPIPIISYVDPKSGKDGMFKKWYQLCFKTYLSLFIRILALYFAVYIISRVGNGKLIDVVDGTYQTNAFVAIFIIIGALMFAKQLPKILEGLGIKLDGDGKFTLNPLKKFEDQALLGKNITGAAAGAVTGALGNKGWRRFTGALGGLGRGALEGKGFKEQQKKQAEVNRKLRQARNNGHTFFGTLNERFGMETGAETGSERFEREQKRLEAKKKFDDANLAYAKGVRSHILDELENKKSDTFTDMPAWLKAQTALREAQAEYQAAINAPGATAASIAQAKEKLAQTQDAVVESVLNSKEEDAYLTAEREKFNIRIKNNEKLAKAAQKDTENGGQSMTEHTGAVNASTIKNIKKYSQGQVNEDEMKLYEVKESDEAYRHQGDKQAAEAGKIDVHFDGFGK